MSGPGRAFAENDTRCVVSYARERSKVSKWQGRLCLMLLGAKGSNLEFRDERFFRSKINAMRIGKISHKNHFEISQILEFLAEVYANHYHVVMGKEELQSLRLFLVAKADRIQSRPRERPFLPLPSAQGDHGHRLIFGIHTFCTLFVPCSEDLFEIAHRFTFCCWF